MWVFSIDHTYSNCMLAFRTFAAQKHSQLKSMILSISADALWSLVNDCDCILVRVEDETPALAVNPLSSPKRGLIAAGLANVKAQKLVNGQLEKER